MPLFFWDEERKKKKKEEEEAKLKAEGEAQLADPRTFLEKVPMHDISGQELPPWKRFIMARQLSDQAVKERREEKKRKEEGERLKDMAVWKRSIVQQNLVEKRAIAEGYKDLSPYEEIKGLHRRKDKAPPPPIYDEDGLPLTACQIEDRHRRYSTSQDREYDGDDSEESSSVTDTYWTGNYNRDENPRSKEIRRESKHSQDTEHRRSNRERTRRASTGNAGVSTRHETRDRESGAARPQTFSRSSSYHPQVSSHRDFMFGLATHKDEDEESKTYARIAESISSNEDAIVINPAFTDEGFHGYANISTETHPSSRDYLHEDTPSDYLHPQSSTRDYLNADLLEDTLHTYENATALKGNAINDYENIDKENDSTRSAKSPDARNQHDVEQLYAKPQKKTHNKEKNVTQIKINQRTTRISSQC